MTQKEIFSEVLAHLINIAEIQTIVYQKSEAVANSDYNEANRLHVEELEKRENLLTVDRMKELHKALQNAE